MTAAESLLAPQKRRARTALMDGARVKQRPESIKRAGTESRLASRCSIAILMYLAGRLTRTRLFSAAYRYYCSSNMPSAILLLAQGAEEMEAVISVDVMRRGGVSIHLN